MRKLLHDLGFFVPGETVTVQNVLFNAKIGVCCCWFGCRCLTSVCSSRLVSVSSVVRVVTCGPLSSTTWPSSVTITCLLTRVSICFVVTCSTLRFLIHSSAIASTINYYIYYPTGLSIKLITKTESVIFTLFLNGDRIDVVILSKDARKSS